MDYLDSYLQGNESQAWDQLCELDDARDTNTFDAARSIAREAMVRVRRNVEMLIPRWENAGHKFGYAWAGAWASDYVRKAPPLLAQPGQETLAALNQYERERGPLPIVLRAFYEVVGAVNFVGDVAKGWPDRETLDPLQVEEFAPQLPRLLADEPHHVVICPDHLLKYFVAGVGPLTIQVPSAAFDPVMQFEGSDLDWEGKPLTFGRYLRTVILERGGIGLIAGCNDDAPDPALIASLKLGLPPF